MKKFLSSFMIIVIFTATMVCGCPHPAQAVSPASHHSDSGNDHHHDNDTTVMPACIGTDMQLPQQINVSTPDLRNSLHFDFIWADEKPAFAPILASNKGIRGPPSGWPDLSQTQPSILLTTQRFLI